MAGRRRKNVTTADYERWWKLGYGRGDGANYKPWIRVQDFPNNLTTSFRVAGADSETETHALSPGEKDVANLLQHLRIPYQEQKPLYPLPEVQALAKALGIRYPHLSNGTPAVLTFDFLLPSPSPFLPSGPVALQYKVSSTFGSGPHLERDLEKLELYRRYAVMRGYCMYLLDERLLSDHVSKTLRNLKQCSQLPAELSESDCLDAALRAFTEHCDTDWTVRQIRDALAAKLSLPAGAALKLFKHILWERQLSFDLNAEFDLHLPVAGLRKPHQLISASSSKAA